MAHFLIGAIALVFLVTGFGRVYCIHGINQVYLGLYKGMFDAAVTLADDAGAYLSEPLFYIPRIQKLLQAYYRDCLTPYCRSYEYEVYGVLGGKRVGGSIKYADTVVTTFTATISDLETRTKKAVFAVERSPYYE